MIVDRVKDINPHKDFYKDRTFKNVSFTIRDFTFSQLCDGNTRKGVIDEIIYLLTYGTGNDNKQINTESKSMNTNKKVVRLTESQLHNIIAESVSQILEAWDDEKMKRAMSNPRYKKMLDKVDPRTFARRVNGINAQGNRRSDNPKIMKNAAIRSFNNKYAKDIEDPKQEYTNRLHMYSNGKDDEILMASILIIKIGVRMNLMHTVKILI